MKEQFRNAALESGFSEFDDSRFIYETASGPAITVHFSDVGGGITYCDDITIEHRGALSIEKEENLVTAVCVALLLERGYEPDCITLEKTWKLGHKNKGRLDILLSKPTPKGKKTPWAMIECKTSSDHGTFASKMRADGGQLFSYWFQDRDAEYLYLFSVNFDSVALDFKADYVSVKRLDTSASSLEELHASWDGTFETLGLLHPLATPYDSEARLLRPDDLKALTAESGKGIFNQFAELLRQHTVSDKANGFNKIFNLFLCKIIDEDSTPPSQALGFQADGHRDGSELIQTLDVLYRKGMEQYLGITVGQEFVTGAQHFAFVEVYNQDSFERNLKILRGVVRILQPYKIKYSTKQQHLGDFFELLLNEGVKQESGQYFTPVPLTSFAVRALPTRVVVRDAVARGGEAIFPRVIDFACGSGHFITEAIDILEKHIFEVESAEISSSRDRQFWESRKRNYLWTKDSVFGVEQDYRLAKVTKIATFLNGDGDATILHGDGLSPFSSETFKGILRAQGAENPVFDMVIANPPYAVANFMENSGAKESVFELKESISAKGSEIELLFLERTSQLLRPGGVAALVFPAGIFTNEAKSYEKARKFLIGNFYVRAILNLGKDAFMATGIRTVLVFLEKRDVRVLHHQAEASEVQSALGRLSREKTLIAWMDQGQAEKNYLGYSFSSRRGYEGIQVYDRSSLFATQQALEEAGDSDLPPYLDDLVRTSFTNQDDLIALIERASLDLENAPAAVQLDLEPVYKNSRVVNTVDLIDQTSSAFQLRTTAAGLNTETRFDFAAAGLESQTLGDLIDDSTISVTSGKRPSGGVARIRSGILSLGGEHVNERLGTLDFSTPKYVPLDFLEDPRIPDMVLRTGDLVVCKDGARSGKVALVSLDTQNEEAPILINEHLYRIRVESAQQPQLAQLLFLFFLSAEGRAELNSSVAGTGQGGISKSRLRKVMVPKCQDVLIQKALEKAEGMKFEQGFKFSDILEL